MKPKFKHDCERCTFLGNFKGFDLYFCPQTPNLPTVLARFSNEGADYVSGIYSDIAPLNEAKKRAKERGLL
jgi:hypothetical protein